MTPIDLGSLEPLTQSVTIGGKPYIVSEASEPAGLAFTNAVATSFKYEVGADGRRYRSGYNDNSNDMEFKLVRECVVPPLPEKVPYRVMKMLYKVVEELTPSLWKDVEVPKA